jgi:peroxiredoxin
MKRSASWVVVALLALGVSALVVPGCGRGTGEATKKETAVGETGTPAAEGAGNVGTSVGDVPPPFALPDLDGQSVSLSDFQGKVVVLDLWATWCAPCRAEVPVLVRLYDELRDQGLVVVGIGLDQGGANVLKPFVEANRVTYPVVVGNPDVQSQYGVTGIPATFIIGRDGRIAATHAGFAPSMEEGLRAEVVKLLGAGATEA